MFLGLAAKKEGFSGVHADRSLPELFIHEQVRFIAEHPSLIRILDSEFWLLDSITPPSASLQD